MNAVRYTKLESSELMGTRTHNAILFTLKSEENPISAEMICAIIGGGTTPEILEPFLSDLMNLGLIDSEFRTSTFEITEDGLEYLPA